MFCTPRFCIHNFEEDGLSIHGVLVESRAQFVFVAVFYSILSPLSSLLSLDFGRTIEFLSSGWYWGLLWGEIHSLDHCIHLVWAVFIVIRVDFILSSFEKIPLFSGFWICTWSFDLFMVILCKTSSLPLRFLSMNFGEILCRFWGTTLPRLGTPGQ
jgi:hypothetical protein